MLCRKRSALALGLYALSLAVLGVAAVLVAAQAYVKIGLVAGLLAYAIACRPRRGPVIVHGADRRWAIPARGLRDLLLGPGTCYTRAWARLRLVDRGGRAHTELVWADELGRAEWRRLELLLREPARPGRELRRRSGNDVGRPDAR